jgi:hypothetical protein
MNRLSPEELFSMDQFELEKEHQDVDMELMRLLQYKHEVYLLMESRRPVVVPSPDAHFMGAM